MRFTAEHRFPAPPAAVAAVLGDPGFYRDLELPDLRLLEVRPAQLAGTVGGERAGAASSEPSQDLTLVLRYEFTGSLDGMALRLLGGDRLTWSQEVHLRGSSGGRLGFAAEAAPRVLYGHADFVLEPLREPEPEPAARPEEGEEPRPLAADRADRTDRADRADRTDRTGGSGRGPDGMSTIRRLDGELVVALPVVGAMAERRIVHGVLERLGVEAAALCERITAAPV